jgi:hypothetical protein
LIATLQLLSVNFLRYTAGTKVKIPIEYINTDLSNDLKKGCFIYRVNNYIECVCDEEVPKSIIVDAAEAMKGQVYRLNNLQFPPRVRPAKSVPPDFVACVVKTPKG